MLEISLLETRISKFYPKYHNALAGNTNPMSVFDTEISKEIADGFITHKSTTQFLKQMISSPIHLSFGDSQKALFRNRVIWTLLPGHDK